MGASTQNLVKNRNFTTLCVILITAGFITLFNTSCSISKIASDMTSGIFKAGSPIFEQEGDVETAEVSGLAMIKTLEVFSYQNPSNSNYLNLLAKSYATYAFGFLENRMLQYQFKDPEKYQMYFDRARSFYKKGKSYGMDLLQRKDSGLVKAIGQGVEAVRKKISHYGKHDVEGVFWTMFNWGSYINLSKDDITIVADLPLVETMMAQIVKVYPGFYFAAPHMFYGVYYASRPAMLGGSPVQSKDHFEEGAKLTHDQSLMIFALEAQYLAVQTMDKSLFEDMIAKVNAGSIEALPEQRLANALAKQRVKFLKDNESHYFN